MSNLNVLPLRHHRETLSWGAGVSTRFAPTRNLLLAALPVENYRHLLSDLEPVELVMDSTIYEAQEGEGFLYFITVGIVARFLETQGGVPAAFAVTGSEGVVGIASFLGGLSTLNRAVVVSPGYAYRLPQSLVKDEVRHNGPLLQLLLRYTQALLAQTGQVVACNRHHNVEQQLCRWILSCTDRTPSNELCLTQQLIASMLGVRRESVTEGAARLQAAGLIHYSRGRITMLDRASLEKRVCECYAAIRNEYDCLLLAEKPQTDVDEHLPARIFRRNGVVFN